MSTQVKCPAPHHPSALFPLLSGSMVRRWGFAVTAESRTTVLGGSCQGTSVHLRRHTPAPSSLRNRSPQPAASGEETFAVTTSKGTVSEIVSWREASPSSAPHRCSSSLTVVGKLPNGRLQLKAPPGNLERQGPQALPWTEAAAAVNGQSFSVVCSRRMMFGRATLESSSKRSCSLGENIAGSLSRWSSEANGGGPLNFQSIHRARGLQLSAHTGS